MTGDPGWWRQASVYQVYPRSFADANGDGVGDLAGVLSRVDYIASLSVDAVWFSPFYPSALADGGYDIDDYRDVDPTIGTLAEFAELVAAFHARGIKTVVDLVPNHSSNRHAWFREAVSAPPGSPERERYLFRDGRGEHGQLPPNDWQSLFGGPAWTRIVDSDGTPGQWYLHLFAPEQPDWNWQNREVRDDFLTTIRFWADHGVDGFRVDVAMALAKDMSEPYADWEQVRAGIFATGETAGAFADGQHPLFDRDELDGIYSEWRRVFDSYDPPLFAVAEAWVPAHRRGRYASPHSLGQAFNFDLLTAAWDADVFGSVIRTNLEFATANDTTSTWVLSNHDVTRHVTRYARADDDGAERALARARAAIALILALPGSTYVYQGEELGLPEVVGIPADQAQDPSATIADGIVVAGRDGCRVPLPWTVGGDFFGFSEGAAHLPQPSWFGDYSVEAESGDEASMLSLYRRAIALRRRLIAEERAQWLDLGGSVLAFRRPNGWVSVTNFGTSAIELPEGEIVLRTDSGSDGRSLEPDSTAWIISR